VEFREGLSLNASIVIKSPTKVWALFVFFSIADTEALITHFLPQLAAVSTVIYSCRSFT